MEKILKEFSAELVSKYELLIEENEKLKNKLIEKNVEEINRFFKERKIHIRDDFSGVLGGGDFYRNYRFHITFLLQGNADSILASIKELEKKHGSNLELTLNSGGLYDFVKLEYTFSFNAVNSLEFSDKFLGLLLKNDLGNLQSIFLEID